MKWIGQHIWDFISTFRSKVFMLEDLEVTGSVKSSNTEIDSDHTATESEEKFVSLIDYDKSGDVSSGQNITVYGQRINLNDNATNNQGILALYGSWVNIDSVNNNGSAVHYGYVAALTDGDAANSYGFWSSVENGGTDFKSVSSIDNGDFFSIATGANGATLLKTNDDDGTSANLELQADGTITLDSAGDIFLEAGGGDVNGDAEHYTFSSSTSGRPILSLKTSNTMPGTSGELRFEKNADNTEDNEYIGQINFYGENNAASPENIQYAHILGAMADQIDGQEAGLLFFGVAAYDGVLTQGLLINGNTNADNEVDVTIGSGAASTATVAGNLRVVTNITATRSYELPDTAAGSHKGGDVYYYGSGTTEKGSVYYMNDSGGWSLADADAESTASGLLAVALGEDPDVDGMLLRGFVTLYTEVEGTEAIGSTLYLSATNGGIATITQPSNSGEIVRVLGYSLHATNNQAYFNPSGTFVEIS